MKDTILKYTISFDRHLVNGIERLHRSGYKYKFLYKYVDLVLSKDFKDFDKRYHKIRVQSHQKIPFKFWVMWWQGEENAPIIVKKNILNLKNIFGDKNVIVLSKNNYDQYVHMPDKLLKMVKVGSINLATWSDLIRFNILNSYGGYWIDSTVAISPKLKSYIERKGNVDFFTLCENNMDYHNVSFSQWTLWLIGGAPHSDIFNYICNFYEFYLKKHSIVIDYFLTDDIIAHYYQHDKNFRISCNKYKENWQPYYWSKYINKKVTPNMLDKFKSELNYSVQKLTYKINTEDFGDPKSLLSYLLNKNYWES